jgi:peroxiredoxin
MNGKYRIIGLSLSNEELKNYADTHLFDFPIYTKISSETLLNYKFGATPQTVVVSPDGKIEKVWKGAYSGNIQSEIEDYFRIKLPGLVESDTSKK